MMYRKKSSRSALIRYLAAIPVFTFVIFLFSNSVVIKDDNPEIFNEKELFYQQDTIVPPTWKKTDREKNVDITYGKGIPAIIMGTDTWINVEEKPLFPGTSSIKESKQKFREYLLEDFDYPNYEDMFDSNVMKVSVGFTITKEGKVSEISLQGESPCKQEMEKKILALNDLNIKWTPGKVNGKKVNTHQSEILKCKN